MIRNRITLAAIMLFAVFADKSQAQKIYWTDESAHTIQRADASGANVEPLVISGLERPEGIALNFGEGKMYWSDRGSGANLNRRADLTGLNVENLAATGPAPGDVAIDVAAGKIYWTNSTSIQCSNLDGTGVQTVVGGPLAILVGIALDVPGGKVYWTQRLPAQIKRADLNGMNVQTLVTSAQGLSLPNFIKLDLGAGKMYWTDESAKIQRANLDGTSVEVVLTSANGLQQPVGLALDLGGGKIYWTDAGTNRIRRANLNGTGAQDLITTGLIDPRGITFDAGCGNGVVTVGEEECDDSNAIDGDGCDSNCTFTGCGNGIVTAGEPCDDGNMVEGDGCDSNCTISVCGNGIVAPGEDCDDGNIFNNDGCAIDCMLEPFLLVDQNATGPMHDGLTWCTAFLELSQALNAVVAHEAVLVANGDYAPDPTGLGDSRDAAFALVNGLRIEGGYAGCGAPVPSARDVVGNTTLLNGDLLGDDGSGGSNAENSYHVVTGVATDLTAVLDGFTVTRGFANVGAGLRNVGGGIFMAPNGGPTIRNCTITNNTSTGGGGGVYKETGAPHFVNCTMAANSTSANGGGMLHQVGASLLVNCRFLGNTAANGGGIFNAPAGANPTLVNCLFSGNAATSNGGGVQNQTNAAPQFVNCVFSLNTAGINGGGINNSGTGSPTVRNTILWGNTDAGGTDESAQINMVNGTLSLNYSILQGLTGGFGGTANSGSNPLFIDANGTDNMAGNADDDVRLSATSPAIDAANNTLVPADGADIDDDSNTSERTPLDFDGNPRFSDDLATANSGVADPPDYPGVADIGAYEIQGCLLAADCSDANLNNIRDDNCKWTSCINGNCQSQGVLFGDMGGGGGNCAPDGSADVNDKFHALNCFSDTNFGGAGEYPCEPEGPTFVYNVDVGGAGLSCCPDGACDANDAFAALNAFSGTSLCTTCPQNTAVCVGGGKSGLPCGSDAACPGGACVIQNPASHPCAPPQAIAPFGPRFVEYAVVSSSASQRTAKPGDLVQVRVFMESAVGALRGYQMHLGVSGGKAGQLELVDVSIETRADHVFANLAHWDAFNVRTGQMLSGLDGAGVPAASKGYLATYTYRVSPDASGTFVVDVLGHTQSKPGNRTFLFGSNNDMIGLMNTRPAAIVVTGGSARSIR